MSGRSQLFKIDVMRRAIASGTAKPKWSPVLVHSSRTAIAAVASVLVARLFRLPETYWAAITTLVITQSSLGTAVAVSGERFMGTVLGATVGAVAASEFEPGMLVFGAGVFILGILSAALHSDRSAYQTRRRHPHDCSACTAHRTCITCIALNGCRRGHP